MNGVRLIAVLVAIVIGAAMWQSMNDEEVPSSGTKPASQPYFSLPELPTGNVPLPAPDPPWNGMAIQIHQGPDALKVYPLMLREIAALGADTVLLSVDGYQKHVESKTITPDPARCPSDEDWLSLFDLAHRLKLRVVFMPKVLLSDPRGKNWRGKIQPANWDEWFESYRKFVVHFAGLAQMGRVEVFIVGSELISTERFTDQWKKVIDEVRRVYSGQLAYSANWDHYRGIQFWDELDIIGMTTYHKLADKPGETAEQIAFRWEPIRKRILNWAAEKNRPLLFTEAGWCSQEGCAVEAWNYYRQSTATDKGRDEQLNCYKAFIDTWADEPSLAGIIWWEWTKNGGNDDVGYCPRGKPAELELRKFFLTRTVPVEDATTNEMEEETVSDR